MTNDENEKQLVARYVRLIPPVSKPARAGVKITGLAGWYELTPEATARLLKEVEEGNNRMLRVHKDVDRELETVMCHLSDYDLDAVFVSGLSLPDVHVHAMARELLARRRAMRGDDLAGDFKATP